MMNKIGQSKEFFLLGKSAKDKTQRKQREWTETQ